VLVCARIVPGIWGARLESGDFPTVVGSPWSLTMVDVAWMAVSVVLGAAMSAWILSACGTNHPGRFLSLCSPSQSLLGEFFRLLSVQCCVLLYYWPFSLIFSFLLVLLLSEVCVMD
jgi:hypothetical protein